MYELNMYRAPPLAIALIFAASSVSGQDMSGCPTLAPLLKNSENIAATIGAKSCQPVLDLEAKKSISCRWDFGFREEAANALFETLITEAHSCIGTDAELALDKQVNHPDSYTLKRYQFDGSVLSLSLKDKTALQKTLVFVRY